LVWKHQEDSGPNLCLECLNTQDPSTLSWIVVYIWPNSLTKYMILDGSSF
jgi:hypothetical protein